MDKDSPAYKQALADADSKYGKKSSIFRSSFIVQRYSELGGKYPPGPKPGSRGLLRWYREQWISVIPYLESGRVVPCGSPAGNEGCRPLIRVTKGTPITITELLELHPRRALLKVARLKKANPDIRVDWKTCTYSKPPE